MERYAPEKMELAPRDLVSRSEQTEIDEGRGVGADKQGIYLDLRHLGREKILSVLPQVREIAIDFTGKDPIDEPVPIQPTAHYSMGGIPTTADGQVIADAEGTPVQGFFAAGEVSCVSVHGANRLGSNSLLEASVFGRRAGKSNCGICAWCPRSLLQSAAILQNATGSVFVNIWNADGTELVDQISEELKITMTQNCGIFRDEAKLQQALNNIHDLKERLQTARIMDKSARFNTDLLAGLETENLVSFSEVIVAGALARTESRGAHSRTDFKDRDDEDWLKHTLAHKDGENGPKLSYKGVNIDYDRFPPQKTAILRGVKLVES